MAVRFVAFITLRNGKRLYARQVGIKAFPIQVPDEELENKKTTSQVKEK